MIVQENKVSMQPRIFFYERSSRAGAMFNFSVGAKPIYTRNADTLNTQKKLLHDPTFKVHRIPMTCIWVERCVSSFRLMDL